MNLVALGVIPAALKCASQSKTIKNSNNNNNSER